MGVFNSTKNFKKSSENRFDSTDNFDVDSAYVSGKLSKMRNDYSKLISDYDYTNTEMSKYVMGEKSYFDKLQAPGYKAVEESPYRERALKIKKELDQNKDFMDPESYLAYSRNLNYIIDDNNSKDRISGFSDVMRERTESGISREDYKKSLDEYAKNSNTLEKAGLSKNSTYNQIETALNDKTIDAGALPTEMGQGRRYQGRKLTSEDKDYLSSLLLTEDKVSTMTDEEILRKIKDKGSPSYKQKIALEEIDRLTKRNEELIKLAEADGNVSSFNPYGDYAEEYADNQQRMEKLRNMIDNDYAGRDVAYYYTDNNGINAMSWENLYYDRKVGNAYKAATDKKYGEYNSAAAATYNEINFIEKVTDAMQWLSQNSTVSAEKKKPYLDIVKEYDEKYGTSYAKEDGIYSTETKNRINSEIKSSDALNKLKENFKKESGATYDAVKDYAKLQQDKETAAKVQETVQTAVEGVNSIPVAGKVLGGIASAISAVPFALVSGNDYIFNLLDSIGHSDYSSDSFRPINTYDDYATNISSEIIGAQTEIYDKAMQEAGVSEKARKFWTSTYGGFSSGVNSLATVVGSCYAFGPVAGQVVSSVILSGQAASSGLQEAVQNGSTTNEALAYGFASGVAEYLGEKISIGSLVDKYLESSFDVSSFKSFIKSFVKDKNLLKMLGQGAVEGSEEVVTEIMNRFSDAVINQDHSKLSNAILTYEAEGLSREEAKKKAFLDVLASAAEQAWGGFVGGIMGGTAAVIGGGVSAARNSVTDIKNQIDIGKSITGTDVGSSALKLAEDMGIDTSKASADVKEGKGLGKLRETVQNNSKNKAMGKTVQKVVQKELAEAKTVAMDITQDEDLAEFAAVIATGLADDNAIEILSQMDEDTAEKVLSAAYKAQERSQSKAVRALLTDTEETSVKPYTSRDITGIKKSGTGIKYVTSDGNEVTADEIGLSSREKVLYKNAVSDMNETDAGEMISEYRRHGEDISPDLFAYTWGYYRNLGKTGATKTSERVTQAIKEIYFSEDTVINDALVTAALAQGVKLKAAEMAKSDINARAERIIAKRKGRAEGKVTGIDLVSKNKRGAKTVSRMLAKTGYDIAFVDGDFKVKGQKISESRTNGIYDENTNTIYLRADAEYNATDVKGILGQTLSHEIAHSIKTWNRQGYEQLTEYIRGVLGADMEKLVTNEMKQRGIGYTEALDEVIADGCEMLLRDSKALEKIAMENAPLFVKIGEAIAEFVSRLREAQKAMYEDTDVLHDSALALKQAVGENIEELQQIFDDVLYNSITNMKNALETAKGKYKAELESNLETLEKAAEKSGIKYSYEGEKSRTADLSALEKAKELEKQGKDSEYIRKTVGWFRGFDGKWRYEIDDSGMKFRRDGDARLIKDDGYRRLNELTDKWAKSFEGGKELSTAEMQEMESLQDKYQDAVWEEKFMLSDFVEHDALFEAYPQLNFVNIAFDSLPHGQKGYFDAHDNTIVLSNSLFGKDSETVLHELQHVIQKIEGFTQGTSPEHSARVSLNNSLKTKDAIRSKLREESKNSPGLLNTIGMYDEYIDYLELHNDNVSSTQFAKAYDRAASEISGERALELFWDYAEATEKYYDIRKRANSIGYDLYRKTAGEIEARDVANRKDMTAEQRKNIRPDIDRTDVVFADSGDAYDIGVLDNGNVYVIASRNVIKSSTVSGMRADISDFFNKMLEKNGTVDIPTLQGDILTISKTTEIKARDNYKTENGKRIKLKNNEFALKLRAESHIDELAEVSKGSDSVDDSKNHGFAKDGFSYRTAYFQDFDGQYYKITISVGKSNTVGTVYNVGKIKKDQLPSAKLVAVVGSKPLGNQSSDVSISDSGENVNSNLKFSQEADEYRELAKNPEKNASSLAELVSRAAKAAGYNSPLLYHGTKNAGFSGFDLSKMDDGSSIFLTSSPDIASTYSGASGTRSIADMRKARSIDAMNAEELTKALNAHSKQNAETDEGIYKYEAYDLKKKEQLTKDVEKGAERLSKTVERLTGEYADRLAEDFDDKTAAVHRQLAELSEKLADGKYSELSTPIYMLLNHTDAFKGETGIAELEKNIRLMNKLNGAKMSSDGVIVRDGLDGYDLRAFSTEQARNELRAAEGAGNYAVYARLGNSLSVDAHGDNWNALDYRVPDGKYEISEEEGQYRIIDKSTRTAVWSDGKMRWDSREQAQKIIDGLSDKDSWTKRLNTTRQIAEYAKAKGYDSVVFKNLCDNGGMNSKVSLDTASDVYVLFNPDDAKSADLVTYDENGDVIPLSERFRNDRTGDEAWKNEDLRFSQETAIDKKFSYDSFVNKPDMHVVTINDGKVYQSNAQTRKEIISAAIGNAKAVGKINENGNAVVHVDDSGAEVIVSRKGIEHSLDRRLNTMGAVTENLGSILKNSILINELVPKKSNVAETYVYIGAAKSSESFYVVEFVVNRYNDELSQMDILYSANTKKEAAALDAPRAGNSSLAITASEISIAELLQIVNDNFPDVLPEGVLKHFGYTSRPEGILGESALFSQETSRDTLFSDMEAVAETDEEKSFIERLRGEIEKANSVQAELADINRQIKEISFTKGSDRSVLPELLEKKQTLEKKLNSLDSKLYAYRGYNTFKELSQRETKDAVTAEKLRSKAALKSQAEKYRDAAAQAKAALEERTEKKRRADIARDIARRIDKIDSIAKADSKTKHIPSALRQAVRDFRAAVDTRTQNYDERIAKVNEAVKKLEEKRSRYDVGSAEYEELSAQIEKKLALAETYGMRGEKAENYLDGILQYYKTYGDGKNGTYLVTDELASIIEDVKNTVGERPLYMLSADELETVLNATKAVQKQIATANKLFKSSRSVSDTVNAAAAQVKDRRNTRAVKNPVQRKALSAATGFFYYNNLKPYALFKNTGSQEMYNLYRRLQRSEGDSARLITKYADKYRETAKKNGVKEGMFGEDVRITLDSGKTIVITQGEALTLHLTQRREQGRTHLLGEGFKPKDGVVRTVENGKVKTRSSADFITLTENDLSKFGEAAGKELRAFGEEMQNYMSTEMSKDGNGVSMALYDVKLFGEKNYISLDVDQSKRVMAIEKSTKPGRLENRGFTQKTVENATQGLLISSFDDVFASHATDMAAYAAFALPLNDMMRVINGKTADGVQLKSLFGEKLSGSIQEFLNDVNGGIRSDDLAIPALFRSFKAAAVGNNLRVAIQQPTAIMRSLSKLNPKYYEMFFSSDSRTRRTLSAQQKTKLLAEMEKYTSTWLVKELGGADINAKRSLGKEITYLGFKDTTAQGRLNTITEKQFWLAEKGDQITWMYIWSACKNEAIDKLKSRQKAHGIGYTYEDVLRMAGDRFDEVTNETQVYDSVFARSKIMRSSNFAAKLYTSFFAEPSTTLNMAYEMVRKFSVGEAGEAVKIGVSLILNGLFTAAAAAVIDATRDDDDDQNFGEKYLEALFSNLLENIEPMGYMPYFRDLISAFKGYDVNRSDVELVSRLVTKVNKLRKEIEKEPRNDRELLESTADMALSIVDMFGIAGTNFKRDFMAIVDTVTKKSNWDEGTKTTLNSSIKDALNGSFRWGKEQSYSDKLYYAVMNDDSSYIERMKGSNDEDEYKSLIKKGLKDHDLRVASAAACHMDGDFDGYERYINDIVKDGFDREHVVSAVLSAENKLLKNGADEDEDVDLVYQIDGMTATKKDIYAEVEKGEYGLLEEYYKLKVDYYKEKEDEEPEKKAVTAVKNLLTSKYKEIYESSDDDGKKKLREMLTDIKVDGHRLYTSDSIRRWDDK